MTKLTKTIVTGAVAVSMALSGLVAMPAFAHGNDDGNKNNKNQSQKIKSNIKHNDDVRFGFGLGLGLGKYINIDTTGTVSGAPLRIFKQEVKEAKKDQKETKKEAKVEFKADIKTASTPEEKNAVVKAYLTSILDAFKIFASAKEAALVKLIASIGTTTPVNHTPVANNQAVTVNEDSNIAVTLTGSDSDGNALTYLVVTNPSHGALSGSVPNLTYTPTANFSGSDSFTFRVNDGSLNSAVATVSITVTGINDGPTANAQSVTTAKNVAKSITLTGTDPEGNTLTYVILTSTTHGTLSGTAPTLSYLPSTDFTGTDSFTFKVNDGTTDSSTVTVTITVNP